jgi:uncharacterized protein DUF1064
MSWTPEQYQAFQRERGQAAFAAADKATKPSKYRNVKTVLNGMTFDSKREAEYWVTLRLREDRGEIVKLDRQVPLPLMCQSHGASLGVNAIVSEYIADFTYIEVSDGSFHVLDAKGMRTRMYQLKKKWLELQSGIVIEEV